MTLLSEIYDVTLKRNYRGKAKQGYVRPTVSQFFTCNKYYEDIISAYIPNAPVITSVAANNGEAVIFFSAPDYDGGTPITQYTAVANPGGLTSSIFGSNSGSITVSGLENNTTYDFVVYATNSRGNSENSNTSYPVTPSESLTGYEMTRSFSTSEESDYVLDGSEIDRGLLMLPQTGSTSSNLQPYQTRYFLEVPWNGTIAFNSPSGLYSGTAGQFGIIRISVLKDNDDIIDLTLANHPKFTYTQYRFQRMYSSTSITSVDNPQQITWTLTSTDGSIVSTIGWVGGSKYSNPYQLEPNDRVFVEHYSVPTQAFINKYGNGMPLYSMELPTYAINTNTFCETTTYSNFILPENTTISSAVFNYFCPASCNINMLVSFDGKNTWKKWSGGSFVDHSDVTTGNTVSEIQSAFSGYNVGSNNSIDFKFRLRTTSSVVSPYISKITLQY